MKVLLISANTEMINMPVLPLGMAFVARSVEDADHEVSQINLMAKPEALKTLAARIQKIQPDIMLKKMNKQYRIVDVRRTSDLLKKCNIRRMGFLLLGGPGETRQTVLESLEFVDSLALAFEFIRAPNWQSMRDRLEKYHLMTTFFFRNSILKMEWRHGYEKLLKHG